MTKYSKMEVKKEVKKKTVFRKALSFDLTVKDNVQFEPENYENVIWLGYDRNYGDIFKVFNDDYVDSFTIYFGEAGDEFNQ